MVDSPHTDAPEVLERIERGLPLVQSLARKIHRKLDASYQLDDLVAAGKIGLIEAARRFDENYGVRFETFAYPRISGEIHLEVGRFSQLKRSAYRRTVALQADAIANGTNVCEATLQTAALQLHENVEEQRAEQNFDDLMGSVTTAAALSLARSRDENEASSESDVEKDYQQRELVQLALNISQELGPDDAAILQRKHFEELSFSDFSEEFGMERSWICRRYNRALHFLRRRLKQLGEEDSGIE